MSSLENLKKKTIRGIQPNCLDYDLLHKYTIFRLQDLTAHVEKTTTQFWKQFIEQQIKSTENKIQNINTEITRIRESLTDKISEVLLNRNTTHALWNSTKQRTPTQIQNQPKSKQIISKNNTSTPKRVTNTSTYHTSNSLESKNNL